MIFNSNKKIMYEYKMISKTVRECEAACNELAKDGWRVVSVCPDQVKGVGVIATLEREVKSN